MGRLSIEKIDNCRFSLGDQAIDAVFGDGIVRAGVHEIYATETAYFCGVIGFAAALVLRAAGTRPIVWVQHDFLDNEIGSLNAIGIAELGLDPSRIILVRTRDTEGVLRAGEQAARCSALGAVVIVAWGEANIINFTASRRLSLAATKSNVPIFMLRAGASPSQSAATTRWMVRSAPSRPLEANAPGFPAFDLRLLRHRGGMAGHVWRLEWDRDQGCFRNRQRCDAAKVSGLMVSVSRDRQALSAAHDIAWRKAG
jgi:protein ImuA